MLMYFDIYSFKLNAKPFNFTPPAQSAMQPMAPINAADQGSKLSLNTPSFTPNAAAGN